MAQSILPPLNQPNQPHIDYIPDYEKYHARTKRRTETEQLKEILPPGFPLRLSSDLVWDGKGLRENYDWNYQLADEDLGEVEAALAHFRDTGLALGHITQETFPLPNLHPKLRAISDEVHNGHGFKVVRGVPVKSHTREENIMIFAGISAHIAPIRGRQDRQLDEGATPINIVLAHIKDLTSQTETSRIGAPAYTTEKQAFHTDIGDVVALFALDEAFEGGQSYLSSSWMVYNELAAKRPDLIWTLSEPWTADTFGKPNTPYRFTPLLYHEPSSSPDTPERVIIQFARRSFTGYAHGGLPRSADIPPITEAQAEALDAVHFSAEKHAVSLEFREGDIQYVNNLGVLHARESFRNSEDKQRHLVRLWLRDPENMWKTHAARGRWDRIYEEVTAETSVFPLEPRARRASRGAAERAEGVDQ